MKKWNQLGYTGLVALACIGGFAACTSEDEVVEYPHFTGQTIKAEFALNVPTDYKTARQHDMVIQDGTSPKFRGIDKIYMMPYLSSIAKGDRPNFGSGGTHKEYVVDGYSSFTGAVIDVNTEGGFDAFTKPQTNSKWYNDVSIPVGVNCFLVYANAKPVADPLLTADKDNGKLVLATQFSNYNEVADLKFSLSPIAKGQGLTSKDEAKNLAAKLNSFLEVSGTVGGQTKTWKDITLQDDVTLGNLLKKFTALRCGSSANILATVNRLYTELYAIKAEKREAGSLAKALIDKIIAVEGNIQFRVKSGTQQLTILEYSKDNNPVSVNFPGAYEMPDGSAVLTYSSPSGFAYTDAEGKNAVGNLNNVCPVNTITYPAELYYRANTPIRTSTEKQSANGDAWANLLQTLYGPYSAGDTENRVIGDATKSVAMLDPLQYSVCQLLTYVRRNAANLMDKADAQIEIPNGLKVTGVLVGGQKSVDWEFKPVSQETEKTVYTLYDQSNIVKAPVKAVYDAPHVQVTRTLVLPTAGVDGEIKANDNDEEVQVALEFENTFGDFMGEKGLIAKGTKFYIVGVLKLSDGTNNDGTIKSIFKEDYVTTAKFTVKSLKHAYNVIPDLRSPKLQLGLSVDLNWTNGLEFDAPME